MITFVATSFNEEYWNCPFVDSMLGQKDKNWKAIIFNNGPNPKGIPQYNDDRIQYTSSPFNSGNWGTQNRASAIKFLVDTEFVINTSIQDYYLPNAVERIYEVINEYKDIDLIHWQAINHLFNYEVLNGEIAFGHIDWGQFCVRTELIKSTGIMQPEHFCSDWFTLQEIIKKGIKIKKINKILTVHN